VSVKKALKSACVVCFAALLPATAHAWSKSYVVEWFEWAFNYGAPGPNVDQPGPDCPTGTNTFDRAKALVTPYRTAEEVAVLLDPNNPTDNPRKLRTTFAYRGPNKENVFFNPTIMPDPGFKEVQGKIAEGFDLDNNPMTGFTAPDGTKGIDNNYYKAAGCIHGYRGPTRNSGVANFQMEAMRTGRFTVLVVLEGRGADPMNDDDVTVGFYGSRSRLVKDAGTGVVDNMSFEIDPDPRFQTLFKAFTRNGVLEQREPIPLLRTHETRKNWIDDPKLEIKQARIRMTMLPDGRMEGMIGGYRDWFEIWAAAAGRSGNGYENGRGATQGVVEESLRRYDSAGFYYAMRRNADGPVNAKGQRDLISVAYRYYMIPAFVFAPGDDKEMTVAKAVTQ